MAITICANGLSIVHKDSGGEASATLPDVCLTTVGNAVVPIPYGNSAKSSDLVDGTTTVFADGGNSIAIKGCRFSKSTGDSGGDKKGIASGTIEAEAKFISASPTVKIEGKGVCRLSDQMTMNNGNTLCLGGLQEKSITITPDEEGTYTVDIEYRYPDGSPVYMADYKLIDSHGEEHIGKLDKFGKAEVSKLPPGSLNLFLGEDQRDIMPSNEPKPNPHYLESPGAFELLAFAVKGLIFYWDEMERPSDYSKWSWGAIMGDFNQDRTAGQIAFDSVITAFPYIDQAADGRDLSANLYAFYNADDIRDENDKYIDLVITIVGFLPTTGSLFKGLFKELKLLGKVASLDSIAAFLRNNAKGDVVKWMRKLDILALKTDIYSQLDKIIQRATMLMKELEQQSRLKGYFVVADAYKACLEQLDELFKKADGPISRVLSDFDDLVEMILPEAPLMTSSSAFNITSGTAQGGTQSEVIKTRKKTVKKKDKCILCHRKKGKKKDECEGANVGSMKKAEFGRAGDSQWDQLKIRNNWNTKAFHPWYYVESSLNAHHLLPPNSFKVKRVNKGNIKKDPKKVTKKKILLRRLGGYCGYDVNHPKNAVVLPNTNELACFLKKPLHRGQHDIGNFSYTNECVFIAHKTLNGEIKGRKRIGSCSEITNSMLIGLFNQSSKIIFDKIYNFKWRLHADGFNYKPNSTPYKGCLNKKDNDKDTIEVPCINTHRLINPITKEQVVVNRDLKIGQ